MSDVARVAEISARSPDGFEDAVSVGVARATETPSGVTSASVKEQQVTVEDGPVVEFKVNLPATSVLE